SRGSWAATSASWCTSGKARMRRSGSSTSGCGWTPATRDRTCTPPSCARSGGSVPASEWRVAMEGFAREHEVAGEVYAATSLAYDLCSAKHACDPEADVLLRHAQALAGAPGRIDLQQVAEIWTMKQDFVLDDMDGAESTRQRLLALG